MSRVVIAVGTLLEFERARRLAGVRARARVVVLFPRLVRARPESTYRNRAFRLAGRRSARALCGLIVGRPAEALVGNAEPDRNERRVVFLARSRFIVDVVVLKVRADVRLRVCLLSFVRRLWARAGLRIRRTPNHEHSNSECKCGNGVTDLHGLILTLVAGSWLMAYGSGLSAQGSRPRLSALGSGRQFEL